MLKVQYVSVFLIKENLSGFNHLKDYLYNSSIIKHMFNAIKFLSRNIWNENLLLFLSITSNYKIEEKYQSTQTQTIALK